MNFIHKEKLYNITKHNCSAQDPDLEIRGGPIKPKKFFWPFGSQFGLKIR